MSMRITFAAITALMTVASVSGAVSAQSYFPGFPAAPEYQPNQTVNRLKAAIPSDAYGSVNARSAASAGRPSNGVVFSGTGLGQDPDRSVRFELLRDRDRGVN